MDSCLTQKQNYVSINYAKIQQISYSQKTKKILKQLFVPKLPHEIVLEVIKYVGFNQVKFNPYNLFYNDQWDTRIPDKVTFV